MKHAVFTEYPENWVFFPDLSDLLHQKVLCGLPLYKHEMRTTYITKAH